MSITIDLPPDLEASLRERYGDPQRAARDALLVELYRTGSISIGRLATLLGLGTIAAQDWLADRGIGPNYDYEDFLADRAAFAKRSASASTTK